MKTQQNSVSPTSLNLLRDCPRCFWQDRHGHPRPKGMFSTVPLRFDRLIRATWDRHLLLGSLPPVLDGLLEGIPANAKVPPWYSEDTGLWLSGALDGCVQVSGGFAPVDQKSRGYPVKQVHPAYETQLSCYGWLLNQSGSPSCGYGYLVYWILPDQEDLVTQDVSITVDVIKVDLDLDLPRALMLRARDVLDLTSPPPASPACEWCRWAGT